jgi:hypothetical protein
MSAQLSHERIEELIVLDALQGLDDAERAELTRLMAEHGPDCPECRELLASYAEVAAALALSIDPLAPSTDAEERLVAGARVVAAEPEADSKVVPIERARAGRARRWIAAGVAAAMLVVGGVVGYALAPKGGGAPVAVAFPPADGQQLSVAFVPGSEQGVVTGSLAPLPEGQVYELWFRDRGGTMMNPAGIFTPSDGVVNADVTLGADMDLLAVTVEPGFQPQPTTDPIFVAEL